ncbi:hypothetical protein ACFONN_07725 [Dyella humi]
MWTPLWFTERLQTYNRRRDDTLTIQDDIAGEAAKALKASIH